MADHDEEWHREIAKQQFNRCWDLIDLTERSPDDEVEMLLAAMTSRWHWGRVGGAEQQATGDWQIAHVASLLGHGELARTFAARNKSDLKEGVRAKRLSARLIGTADILIAIAGAAGPAIEMARLMRIELEHYEKIEGDALEIDGKANKLSQMIRANLPAAMQGMVVVPLFAGYDLRRHQGRMWKFDVTGGRYEEAEFEATGSGGLYARESLKKTYNAGASRDDALAASVQALTDAADEDRGTGGIDTLRGIFPTVIFCTTAGIEQAPEGDIRAAYEQLVARREA